ncbi:UNVERIFIED_CONTAM: hypothetical protein Slati_3485100 [Sesamum latifolium]|uniref:Secreted protein n=1 Tax=Sesamum latifolium TaxID=2727402 RepID=A0AAW2UHR7_9LAMI
MFSSKNCVIFSSLCARTESVLLLFYALSLVAQVPVARVAGRHPQLARVVADRRLLQACCSQRAHAISWSRYSRSLLEESPDRYMLKARGPCTLRPRRPSAFRDLR